MKKNMIKKKNKKERKIKKWFSKKKNVGEYKHFSFFRLLAPKVVVLALRLGFALSEPFSRFFLSRSLLHSNSSRHFLASLSRVHFLPPEMHGDSVKPLLISRVTRSRHWTERG